MLGDENDNSGNKESLLPENEWQSIASGTSDESGKIAFKNLTEGTYRLTETNAPAGYELDITPYIIEIRLDRNTMEYQYSITRDGQIITLDGSGTSKNPFKITNRLTYELPSTGGSGIYWYMFSGMLLMSAVAGITYRNKRKGVLGS